MQEPAADRAEEPVESRGIVGVAAVDYGQRVPLHAVFLQQRHAPHHRLERGASLPVAAVEVVRLGRSVERDSHQPAVFAKELAPRIVQKRAVGLDAVVDLPSVGVTPLQFDHAAVEVARTQQGFASVPCEGYGVARLCGDVVADEAFEQFVAHRLRGCGGVEAALFEVVAIGAPQVAARTRGFGHYIEGPHVLPV